MFRVELVETHTLPPHAAHHLNSLNTSQKNTPKSGSVFCSSMFFPLLFPRFSHPSIPVPACSYLASHCFPLISPSFSLIFSLLLLPSIFFFHLPLPSIFFFPLLLPSSSFFLPFSFLPFFSSLRFFLLLHFSFFIFSFSKNQNLYMFIGRVTYE